MRFTAWPTHLGDGKKGKGKKKKNLISLIKIFYQTDFSSPQSTLQSLLYPEAYSSEGMADSNWGGGYGSPNKKTRTKRWLKK